MRSGCGNAVIVCALLNAAAIAGGAAAIAGGAAVNAGHAAAIAGDVPTVPRLLNIDSCLSRLDPQLDIGYDRIAARCPELVRELDGGAWAAWLPRGWKEPGNDLSAGGLRELRELVERESVNGAISRPPDVRQLKTVLTQLAGASNEGWWQRVKSWLRSILERREQPTDESWLTRMVSHVGVSQSAIRLISYAALAAVVLLAGVIVVNEARAAGLIPKRRGAARQERSAAAGARVVGWDEIATARAEDRPRLLLELILRRLSDRGFLPPAGALTVRELTRAARLPEADDRSRLEDLAFAAERVRYSDRTAALEEPVARGRELLDRLDAGVRS